MLGSRVSSSFPLSLRRSNLFIARNAALPSVINAAVLTSAFSAGNSGMYSTSRILYGLSVRRQAPKFMSKCTSSGLPYVAILISVRILVNKSIKMALTFD